MNIGKSIFGVNNADTIPWTINLTKLKLTATSTLPLIAKPPHGGLFINVWVSWSAASTNSLSGTKKRDVKSSIIASVLTGKSTKSHSSNWMTPFLNP